MRTGGAFYVADVLLGLLIAPNKFYVFSFAAMGLYIVIIEAAWRFLGRSSRTQRQTIFWAVKYMAFNMSMYRLMSGRKSEEECFRGMLFLGLGIQ